MEPTTQNWYSARVPSPTTYLLLFRGVGGPVQLPVAPLRLALTKAGFTQCTTYINSGNALVRSTFSREDTLARVVDVCKKKFRYDRSIFAPTSAEWDAVVHNDPFPNKAEGKHVHAVLLEDLPEPQALTALQALAVGDESLKVLKGPPSTRFGPYHVCYVHTPVGFGTSRLGARLDKGLRVTNTARNWNTVLKLQALAKGLDT